MVVLECRAFEYIGYCHLRSDTNVFHSFVYCCAHYSGSEKELKAILSKEGAWPFIGPCCHGLFIQMVGCHFGNVQLKRPLSLSWNKGEGWLPACNLRLPNIVMVICVTWSTNSGADIHKLNSIGCLYSDFKWWKFSRRLHDKSGDLSCWHHTPKFSTLRDLKQETINFK